MTDGAHELRVVGALESRSASRLVRRAEQVGGERLRRLDGAQHVAGNGAIVLDVVQRIRHRNRGAGRAVTERGVTDGVQDGERREGPRGIVNDDVLRRGRLEEDGDTLLPRGSPRENGDVASFGKDAPSVTFQSGRHGDEDRVAHTREACHGMPQEAVASQFEERLGTHPEARTGTGCRDETGYRRQASSFQRGLRTFSTPT